MSPEREPFFRAPWPPILIAGGIVALFAVQSLFSVDAVAEAYGFSSAALQQGRCGALVTALFVHGSWTHVLVNAASALAFGAPTARYLGLTRSGVAGFFLFYLACGVLANLGYGLLHPGEANPVVGASGAISGLMGAAARLIASRGERLGALTSRDVIGMSVALLIVNLLFAAFGAPGTGGAPIAWEAHLIGFGAGLLGIGLVARLFRRVETVTD
ncbi:MAG TPA: rhomboid family intramembrane serine protease [Phenylobacterium sp.]